ncbi:hypothetical protein HMPREF2528_03230 [Rothia sp. HMSC078H08]|nr:hypothetical protein HMPREF2528_03230 [Rothia sp. HMSC078H08]
MVSLYESAPGEGNRGPDNFTGNPAEQIQRVTPSSRPVEPSGEGAEVRSEYFSIRFWARRANMANISDIFTVRV